MDKFTNTPDLELKEAIDREGVVFRIEPMTRYLSQKQFISASTLHTIISQTPKDFIFEYENPKEETEATTEGSAFHTWILQPDNFGKEFLVLERSKLPRPDQDFRNTDNKIYKKDMMAQAQISGKGFLMEDQMVDIVGMQAALENYEPTYNILSQKAIVELSVYTKMEYNGTWYYVKLRPDFISMVKPTFVDLKKTRCASPEPNKFPNDAAEFGYEIKVAFYYDLLRQVWDKLKEFAKNTYGYEITNELRRAIIIAVENKEPYKMMIYPIPDVTLDDGRYRYNMAFGRFAEALESGEWQGYEVMAEEGSYGMVDLILPNWRRKEIIK